MGPLHVQGLSNFEKVTRYSIFSQTIKIMSVNCFLHVRGEFQKQGLSMFWTKKFIIFVCFGLRQKKSKIKKYIFLTPSLSTYEGDC